MTEEGHSEKEDQPAISSEVMEEIAGRKVQMRPKMHFFLWSMLFGIGVGVALVAALSFGALATIRWKVYSPTEFLAMGREGLHPFILVFPWVTLFVALAALALAIWMVRQYDFSYKKHAVVGLLGGAALLVVAAFFVGHVVVQKNVHERHKLPFVHGRGGRMVGLVEQVSSEERLFMMRTPRGELVRVLWDDETRMRSGFIEVGNRVRVIGDVDEQIVPVTIEARVIGGRPGPRVKGEVHRLRRGGPRRLAPDRHF